MKFKVISDLHVDINAHLIPEMKFDTEAFYLIAGDISGDRHITTKCLRDKNIKGVFTNILLLFPIRAILGILLPRLS